MKYITLWGKRPYSPFLMYLVIKATVLGFKKVYPESKIKSGGSYWKNASVNYFYPQKELTDTVESLSQKSIKNPTFLFNFFEIAFKKARKLKIFSEKYFQSDLPNKTSEELIIYIEKCANAFYEMYFYGTVASLLGYQQESLIYKKMNHILLRKVKSEPEKFADYLVVLTNPPKKLITNDLDLRILKLAEKAKEREISSKKDIIKNFSKEIKNIEEEFGWISFDFCDTIIWDKNHYVKLIRENIQNNIKEKIKGIENYEKNIKQKFNNLIKKLSISDKERRIFELIRNLGYYKWLREYEFQKAWYNLKFVQDEIGRRCGLSTLESKYLLHHEYTAALRDPKKYKNLAKKRIKNILIMIYAGRETIILSGNKAEQKFRKLKFWAEKTGLIKESFTGMPANAGKVEGIVKIIHLVKDINKIAKGDILVAQTTNPNLVPAMKKAAAIITDEGGITSHAAIVSRELKKPCIIGTKIATKVLHDGDMVEVDANKGIVKILKKK